MGLAEGQLLAEQGKALAISIRKSWQASAESALSLLAAGDVSFTADDLIAMVGLPSAGINANNAVGAVLSGAARRGIIIRVGFRPANRTSSHARMLSVWRGKQG